MNAPTQRTLTGEQLWAWAQNYDLRELEKALARLLSPMRGRELSPDERNRLRDVHLAIDGAPVELNLTWLRRSGHGLVESRLDELRATAADGREIAHRLAFELRVFDGKFADLAGAFLRCGKDDEPIFSACSDPATRGVRVLALLALRGGALGLPEVTHPDDDTVSGAMLKIRKSLPRSVSARADRLRQLREAEKLKPETASVVRKKKAALRRKTQG